MKRLARYMLIVYSLALVSLCVCVHFDNGNWWPVTLFLFSPRWMVAVPLVVLVPLTVVTEWRLSSVYLLHGGAVVFLLQGFQVAGERLPEAGDEQTVLRIMTSRLHGVRIDHVLADHSWQVRSASVGNGFGGDHCPVIAELVASPFSGAVRLEQAGRPCSR